MKENPSSSYDFRPEAMLPAWLVTDDALIVRNWNDFTNELLEIFGVAPLLADHRLSIDLSPFSDESVRSLWECILDPQDLNYLAEALRVLKEHLTIIKRFNQKSTMRPLEPLVEELARVQGCEGVTPYVYRPFQKMFRLGVKVSPIQGVRLIMKLLDNPELRGSMMGHIDIVIAYQLTADWAQNRLSTVSFLGVQPAIHDASERHRLWEEWKTEELANAKAEEQAQVTQFLSHAFKTPISNIQSMAGELQNAQLAESYRSKVCEQLGSHISDLSNLSDLILFINTSESIPAKLCATFPQDLFASQSVTISEVKVEIAKTFQSVTSGRTRDPQDIRKVDSLSGNRTRQQLDEEFEQALDGYLETAENTLVLDGLDGVTSFYLALDLPEGNHEFARTIIKKVKTTFLNLLLVEMLLNAIKYAERREPKVKIVFDFTPTRDCLEISVINNGIVLTAKEFENSLQELAMKHGEKRRALGLSLNKRAAQILGWELQWREPAEPGTHLVLSIPFRD